MPSNSSARHHDFGASVPVETASDLSISNVVAICRRHIVLLVLWVGVFGVVTVLVVRSLQPRYRAEATLIIDTRVPQISNLKSAVSTPFTTQDTAAVMRSEVQLLGSRKLAAQVIDKMDLADNPSFQSHPGLSARLVGALRGLCTSVAGAACAAKPAEPDTPARMRDRLISAYLGRFSAFNDGRSFTLSVSFQDSDPKLAAAVVNTHVELYLADQRAFKRRASASGVQWIGEELTQLGATLAAKQRQLQALREASGLIYTNGTTVVAQQVADINTQLIQARADMAQRQARLPGARGSGRPGGTSTHSEVLNSPLIQTLRSQESEARQALDSLSQTHGPDFPGVLQAQARVSEVERRIGSETARIVASDHGDASVATRRVTELERALAELQTKLLAQDQASSRAVEMERDLAGTRSVYKDLLERQQELEVQAGTEESDARLVSSAAEPLVPFFPNKTIMLSLGLLVGMVSGVGGAFLIDRPERGIQFPSQLQGLLGMPALTPLPQVPGQRKRASLADYVLDCPRSQFAEGLRSLRGDIMAFQPDRPPKVLAITSALPQEGKTSVATALARSMAVSGLHVLLVDCDLRRSSVGAAMGVRAGPQGIVSVLRGECSLADAVRPDSRTSLDLLLVETSASTPLDLLGGREFVAMLAAARAVYDFVVLDTPPQGAVSDALLIAEHADATLLTVRWNSTPPAVVRWTLRAFETRGLLPQGVFLNRVDYSWLTKKDPDLGTAYRSTRSYYLTS